jgi:[pyruvate, water dikinase]-phosphate phosphotransferase / [pyruvate, water dikinase] kinase
MALMVMILSGGTGRTANEVLNAALAQFDDETKRNVTVVRHANVRTQADALRIVKKAQKENAVLVHSLVEPKVRELVVREAERRMVSTIDVLGPILAVLEDRLSVAPKRAPGLSYELKREYFDRIDAVNFTLAHDDGSQMRDIQRAEVVLVGVSRVAKSVTCFYLAYRGIRAANVPLIFGHQPPEALGELDPRRVIGLTMNPQRLHAIRSARLEHMAVASLEPYVHVRKVAEEIRYAQQIMDQHGWQCIDVSYKAVEEVAAEIIHMLPS